MPRLARLPLALSVLLVAWSVLALQPDDAPPPAAPAPEPPARTRIPHEEEMPDAPKPPYKRIDLDDDLPDVAAALGAYYVRLDGVARAAATAKNPTVKEFLTGFTVAYDRVTERAPRNRRIPRYRVTPLPLLWESLGGVKFPDEFGVVPMDEENRPDEEVKALTRPGVARIEPFEKIALAAADRFLSAHPPEAGPAPTPGEKLAAAERVLSEVLLFHERARELNRRKGKVWDAVKAEVNGKLTEVRVALLKQLVVEKDWASLRALHPLLVIRYRNDPKVLEIVYAAQLAEAEDRLKSDKASDLEKARVLLDEYDARFPNSTDETAARIRAAIAEKAAKLLADASRLSLQNPNEAKNLLRTVEGLAPDAPGLRQQQQELLKAGYEVLLVGTRRMPERMTPGTARWDSEKQAAELMFEPLIAAIPDEATGVRYWPCLAAERPSLGAMVREFPLVGNAEWAGPHRGLFDLSDLTGTVDLLRRRAGTWEAEPVGWIKDVAAVPGDPGRVRVRFDRGHPDPRGLLTFKVLPARWLAAAGKEADDREFARKPFGTGPFRLSPSYHPPGPADPVPAKVAFLSNPSYGRRSGKIGTPALKEVHFVNLARFADTVRAFQQGDLHVLTDVPTADLSKYEAENGLKGMVRVVTAEGSRRVHMLAVNHRRPSLQSVDLRRGLFHAIDREAILTDVFRAGRPSAHRALTGPFPPDSWAAGKSKNPNAPDGFDRDLAAAKFRAYRDAGGARVLRLAVPADDPLARAACERIRADVEAAGGGANGNGVSVELEPLPPADFYRQVQEEHRYDLAYLPFDYRDDWYPLGLAAFLDPSAAGPNGRNVLGFLAPGTNPTNEADTLARLLADAAVHRDPAVFVPITHDIHRRFNEVVPFVPLWHLDRHMVVASAVKVTFDGQDEEASLKLLDQTSLFTSVARWRME